MDKRKQLMNQALEAQKLYLEIRRGRIVGDKAKKLDPALEGLREALGAQEPEPEERDLSDDT